MFNSALKKLLERLNPKRQDVPSERVFVAAFGKHPGWDDHIDDIGLETDVFVAAKRILYVQGIGGNIDSGRWDKLEEHQLMEKFKHAFVWYLDSSVIVGRMWSSRDGKGRTSYPMVVCVQCWQLPLEWVVKNILPLLERIEESCVATTSAADVVMTMENAQKQYRELANQCQVSSDGPPVYPDALGKLAEHPEMGPHREGFLRIMYHMEREVARYYPDTGKGKSLRPTSLRVPVRPSAVLENTLLWVSFLVGKFGATTPILVLMPLDENWMDIVIGEPTDLQLYCLRASLSVIPLTNSIPYNMGPEFIERANKLIDDSRSGKAEGSARTPA